MKILVIEDDKIAQLGIKKIFGAAQDTVEIYISENGEEGLDFLKNHRILWWEGVVRISSGAGNNSYNSASAIYEWSRLSRA
jgi:DNA-binding LytR/AlgR family response regulator